MSIKLTAELRISKVNDKDTEDDVSLLLTCEDAGDEVSLIFEDASNEKQVTLVVDSSELLEAVARISGMAFGQAVPKQEVI